MVLAVGLCVCVCLRLCVCVCLRSGVGAGVGMLLVLPDLRGGRGSAARPGSTISSSVEAEVRFARREVEKAL